MSTHLPRKWSFFLLLVLLSAARSTSAQPALAKPSILKLKHPIFTFAFVPGSQKLISFELAVNKKKAGGAMQLWNTQTGTLLKEMAFQSPPVWGAAFSSDAMSLATAHQNQVLLWNTQTGQLKRRIYTGAEKVALSPDGKFMAVVGGSNEKTRDEVRLWDTMTGKWLGRLTRGESEINTRSGRALKDYVVEDERKQEMKWVWWHPDGKRIVAVDAYYTCRFWDLATRRLDVTLPLFDTILYAIDPRVIISKDSSRIASIYLYCVTSTPPEPVFTTVLRLYNLHTDIDKDKDITVGGGSGEDLESASGAMAFSPDGKTLVSELWRAEDNGLQTIRFYDVESGEVKQKVDDPFQSASLALNYSTDGKTMALANGKSLALWKLN